MEEKDFYKDLGAYFKEIREQAGLKQKEVAEKAGLLPGDLSNFENRGRKLSAYRLSLLFKAVGFDIFKKKLNGSNLRLNVKMI